MDEPTIAEMARAVAAALEDESAWCTGAFARTADGKLCHPGDAVARHWCAQGHANRLFGDRRGLLFHAYNPRDYGALAVDNDHPSRGREYVEHMTALLHAFALLAAYRLGRWRSIAERERLAQHVRETAASLDKANARIRELIVERDAWIARAQEARDVAQQLDSELDFFSRRVEGRSVN